MTTTHVILLTYGEPPVTAFREQWRYSNRILSRLTRLVAPIPPIAVPLIGAWRGYRRSRLWTRMKYASPLESITERQAQGIQRELNELEPNMDWRVRLAYEFRDPDLPAVLSQIRLEDCPNIILAPLYVAACDFTSEISQRDYERFQERHGAPLPEGKWIIFRSHLRDLARIMSNHVRAESDRFRVDAEARKQTGLLLGCHGTVIYPPPGITDTGYPDTFQLYQLLEQLLAPEFKAVAIGWLNHQLGGEWTSPSLDVSARKMLEEGITRFVYFPFGFLGDNAETQLEGRMVLESVGISSYHHLPCLNDRPEFLHYLAKQIMRSAEPSPETGAHSASAA